MAPELRYRLAVLAEWVVSIKSVPQHVDQSVLNVVTDAVAAAVAGHKLDGPVAAQKTAVELGGDGSCSIWFTGKKGSCFWAAYANAMSICILDLDDGHRLAAGHPGAAIIAAVLAVAEAINASPERITIAIVIGYEVAVRIAASRNPATIKTNITGHWVGQGVAAAVGWLMKDGKGTIAHGMALAGATAPNMQVASYTKAGGHAKEGIPWATYRGLWALHEARNGMKGPLDILDGEGILSHELTRDGSQGWHIETTYFKLYGCCRWWHALIDAILEIREQFSDWDAVIKIQLDTFDRTMTQSNQFRPLQLVDAQYSAYFCVAAVAIHGPECLLPMTSALLLDEKVVQLAEKMELVVVQRYSDMFPKSAPGRVTVMTRDENMTIEVLAPKGDAINPLSQGDVMRKLRRLSSQAIGESETARLEKALAPLRSDMIFKSLMEFL